MTLERIDKQVVIAAPLERVWQAISDAAHFGCWFGVAFDGPFEAGRRLTGRIVPTCVDADIARLQEPHAGKTFEWLVERIEPMRECVFRWHPFAIDPQVDYSREPMTRICFALAAQREGVRVSITESGFEQIPTARRAQAIAANEGGWEAQTKLLARYLAPAPGQ